MGIGGPRMCAEGMESLFPMDELSVMGLVEILPKYFHLKRRIRETAEAVIAAKPDVLITIDSPDFSLRVAKLVKAGSDIRTVHYVAPTVWAWRPGRAAKMAAMIDHVLALFPFEPPLMQAHGMECDFVGHPIATEAQASEAEAAQFRLSHGIGDAPMLLLLPGSRRGEVGRMAPVLGETLRQMTEARPDLRAVLPMAGPVAGLVTEMVSGWPVKPILLDPREGGEAQKRAAFRAADVAIAASGTVSLELAASRTPMVIGYDMAPLTRMIMSRMLITDTVTLVNHVAESRTVPEFLGKQCRPDLLSAAALSVLDAPGAQQRAMELTMERLGEGGDPPGLRAARAVLARL
ncbi:MAG: lipid-A-disaccharide synthase, partial [Pseudooceanicola atlanticus]